MLGPIVSERFIGRAHRHLNPNRRIRAFPALGVVDPVRTQPPFLIANASSQAWIRRIYLKSNAIFFAHEPKRSLVAVVASLGYVTTSLNVDRWRDAGNDPRGDILQCRFGLDEVRSLGALWRPLTVACDQLCTPVEF